MASESRSTQAAAQLIAEVGSVEVARDPEVRQLRAQLKRGEQELDLLRKPWSSSASRPGGPPARAPALSGAARVS